MTVSDLRVTIGDTEILQNVNLHAHCGNLLAIIGRNGAGKSTLLKALLGEISYSGKIEFTDVHAHIHRRPSIGYVPQSLFVDRNTPVSVYDLMAGAISRAPVFLTRTATVRKRVEEQLKIFDCADLMDAAVCDLSGGERQRVLLSLALSPVPDLLLLDEPAAGIDQNGIRQLYQTLDQVKKEYDLTLMMVSHDLEYVRKYADKVILLDKTVLAAGTPEQVFASEAFEQVFGVE